MSSYSKSYTTQNISSLIKDFASKKTSITKYLISLFEYIESVNPNLNALTSLQKEAALKRAAELESKPAQPHEFLYGIPFIIKENIQKLNYPVECASAILKGYKGQFDATAVTHLENAGAIIIATANMDEFAMGSSNEHSVHGAVLNPHDLSRVSGGSSGGPASACAAGFSPVTLGSDTGGSVREPAAFCGIFGFKPSYGRISRFGLVAYGSSLDQISPFARCAEDLDVTLRALGHHDAHDATSMLGSYESLLNKVEIKGKKIGVLRSLLTQGVDDNVLKEFQSLENNLKKCGAEIFDIEIPALIHTLSAYYVIACAEASSNLSRFDGIRFGHRAKNTQDLNDLYCKTRSEGFGQEVKRRIMLGTFALSAGYYDAYYGKAQAVREVMTAEFAELFKRLDFIYLPTAPASAFKLGESKQDPLKERLYDIFTIPANLARTPAISVPALVAKNSLPVGLQFIAAQGQDAKLIAFAHALEKQNLIGTTPLVS
ncbi:MAG: Asp-tRNA(Asn)/Glu-tRNA(Gln) amidotransferase subunit GatA [Bdellovibrionota bacterium]